MNFFIENNRTELITKLLNATLDLKLNLPVSKDLSSLLSLKDTVTLSESLQKILQTIQKDSLPEPLKRFVAKELIQIQKSTPLFFEPALNILNESTVKTANPAPVLQNITQALSTLTKTYNEQTQKISDFQKIGLHSEHQQNFNAIYKVIRNVNEGNFKNETIESVSQFIKTSTQEIKSNVAIDLFAATTFTNEDLKLTDYLQVAGDADPVKVALLVLEVKKKEPPKEFAKFMADFKAAIQEGEGKIASFVEQALIKYKPRLPFEGAQVHYPHEGLIKGTKEGYLPVIFEVIDQQAGLVPSENLYAVVGKENIKTSFNIPPGLILPTSFPGEISQVQIKLKKKKEAKEEDLFSFFAYILGGNDEASEESDKDDKLHQRKRKESLQKYSDSTPVDSPLLGEIKLDVEKPLVLFRKPDGKLRAMLQLKFNFLLELIDPACKYSRESFLSFSASDEVIQFNQAVKDLGKFGMKAYDDYLASLNRLFDALESFFPGKLKKSFLEAKTFLRDQVLMGLAGKPNSSKQVEMLESTKKGDLLASTCTTMSQLLADSKKESQAFVGLVSAHQLAEDKPKAVDKIALFLKKLRASLKTQSSSKALAVPGATLNDHEEAETFLKHVKFI